MQQMKQRDEIDSFIANVKELAFNHSQGQVDVVKDLSCCVIL